MIRYCVVFLLPIYFFLAGSFALAQSGTTPAVVGDVNPTTIADDSTDTRHSQVQFGYERIDFWADHSLFDLAKNQLTATGNIRIVTLEGELTADSISLDLAKQTGKLTEATARYHKIILRAESIEMLPDQAIALHARITTCDLEKPHYEIGAQLVVVHFTTATSRTDTSHQQRSVDRVNVGGGGINLYHKQLLSIPAFHLTPGTSGVSSQSLPLPYPGYSKLDGPFIRYRWGQQLKAKQWSIDSEVRLTTRQGIRGLVYSRYKINQKGDALMLAVSRQEDLGDQPFASRRIDTGLSKVFVSRQPELSFTTASRQVAPFLHWDLQLAAGQYHQSPRGTSGEEHSITETRATVTPSLLVGPFRVGNKISLESVFAYRDATYGNDDHSEVFYRRFSLDTQPADGWTLSLDLVRRTPHGSTPFRFDRVDVTNGLTTSVGLPAIGSWRVKLSNLYDLQRGESRDKGIDVSYRAHCLDYTLGWKQSRGLFNIGISLVGWNSATNQD